MQRIISRVLFLCILIVLSSGIAFSYSWDISTIDYLASPDCNTFLSIDDSGKLSIAYQGTIERLKGAEFDGNFWSIDFPNELYFNWDDVAQASALRDSSYAVDGKISVVDGVLKYSYKNGSYWKLDVVDSASEVGNFPSLEYDLDGNACISYYDMSTGALKYAKASPELSSQSFSILANTPVIKPILTLTASAKSIIEGQSVTLNWDSTNADFVYKSNCNATTVDGTITLQPLKTISYYITVSTNLKRRVTKRVTVKVLPLIPTIKFAASPSTVILGEKVALAWYSTDATSVYRSNFGAGDVDGAIVVAPVKTVNNQLIVTNQYKRRSKTATARITVKKKGIALPDLTAPLITKPKTQAPGSFLGMNAVITAYAADANGLGNVAVRITSPSGSKVTVPIPNITGSKYSIKYNLSPNISDKPAKYTVEVIASDSSGNISVSEAGLLEVPAADLPPMP